MWLLLSPDEEPLELRQLLMNDRRGCRCEGEMEGVGERQAGVDLAFLGDAHVAGPENKDPGIIGMLEEVSKPKNLLLSSGVCLPHGQILWCWWGDNPQFLPNYVVKDVHAQQRLVDVGPRDVPSRREDAAVRADYRYVGKSKVLRRKVPQHRCYFRTERVVRHVCEHTAMAARVLRLPRRQTRYQCCCKDIVSLILKLNRLGTTAVTIQKDEY